MNKPTTDNTNNKYPVIELQSKEEPMHQFDNKEENVIQNKTSKSNESYLFFFLNSNLLDFFIS